MNNQRLINAFESNPPNTPITEEEFRIGIYITMSDDVNLGCEINSLDEESEVYKHFKPMIKGFQMQIFLKRLELLAGLKITLGAFIMVAQHLNSAGDAVMYAYYLSRLFPKGSLIDVDGITMKAFPMGFFSEEQLKNIWDAQKVRPNDGLDECHCYGAHDNLLDYVETWKNDNTFVNN